MNCTVAQKTQTHIQIAVEGLFMPWLLNSVKDRVTKSGLANRGIHTFFDLIEIDEDRPIRSFYA